MLNTICSNLDLNYEDLKNTDVDYFDKQVKQSIKSLREKERKFALSSDKEIRHENFGEKGRNDRRSL